MGWSAPDWPIGPRASDISSPPCLPRLLPAGALGRVGLAPTGKRRLFTAHAESDRWPNGGNGRDSGRTSPTLKRAETAQSRPWRWTALKPRLTHCGRSATPDHRFLGSSSVPRRLAGYINDWQTIQSLYEHSEFHIVFLRAGEHLCSVTGCSNPFATASGGIAMNGTDCGANDGGSLGDRAVTQEITRHAVVTESLSSATSGPRTRKPRRPATSNPPQISRLTLSQTIPAIRVWTG